MAVHQLRPEDVLVRRALVRNDDAGEEAQAWWATIRGAADDPDGEKTLAAVQTGPLVALVVARSIIRGPARVGPAGAGDVLWPQVHTDAPNAAESLLAVFRYLEALPENLTKNGWTWALLCRLSDEGPVAQIYAIMWDGSIVASPPAAIIPRGANSVGIRLPEEHAATWETVVRHKEWPAVHAAVWDYLVTSYTT